MFTGLVHGIALLTSIKKKNRFHTYQVTFPSYLLYSLKIGDSIANNGCCLTVTKIKNNDVSFDVMKATLETTNFPFLPLYSGINIERSLKFGDEIGGHIVSGHIMTTAKVLKIEFSKNNRKIFFQINNLIVMKYIFLKGFIAIDGVSLTVNTIYKNTFSVCLIPETIRSTNFNKKNIGDVVNIEVDYYTQIIIEKLDQYLCQKNFLLK
ncbi:riboflavin synthase subunit alpha [Buchnera aphidicola]|uniref:riboflavin synthase subunit alpha n=1 Tax=Buchnera aphidicola TaxID=9 RepID=UPI003464D180